MTLTFFNTSYTCNPEIDVPINRTGADSLICHYITESGTPDTASFGGISDMTLFKITDGDKEYTAADLSIPINPEYQLRADVEYIAMVTGVEL